MKAKHILMISIISIFGTSLSAQNNYEKRADPDNYKIPVMKAICYGLTAPSPHNTQSWFIDTISDTEMLLYVKHLLPATDPPARQIHMGAGCFIELVSIGMSEEGYKTIVDYFPQGEYRVKPFEIAEKPVCKITLVKNNETAKDILFDFIYQRGTNRSPYKGKMISTEEFEQMISLMGPHTSEMIFISGKKQMEPYLTIFSEAMEIETRTKAANEETRRMFRFSEKERVEKKDGISIPQMGYTGMIEKIAEKSLNNGDSLTWHSEKNVKATMKGINKGIYSSKGIIIFKTNTNTMLDWVLSGRDYARFNIAIAKMGIVTHPYNQVIQEYPEMEALQKEFKELAGIKPGEKTQMIVRIGRAESGYKSWRKKPEDYLIR
jgi:hypothetical protein